MKNRPWKWAQSLCVLWFFLSWFVSFSMNTNSFRKRLIRTEGRLGSTRTLLRVTLSLHRLKPEAGYQGTSACSMNQDSLVLDEPVRSVKPVSTSWLAAWCFPLDTAVFVIGCQRGRWLRSNLSWGEQWEPSLMCFSFGAVYLYLPGKGLVAKRLSFLRSAPMFETFGSIVPNTVTGDQF